MSRTNASFLAFSENKHCSAKSSYNSAQPFLSVGTPSVRMRVQRLKDNGESILSVAHGFGTHSERVMFIRMYVEALDLSLQLIE
ncbi:uncharacterized [Tachysurus ichikawai]